MSKKTIKKLVRVRAPEDDWQIVERLQTLVGAQSLNELVAIALEYLAGGVSEEIRQRKEAAEAEKAAKEEVERKERQMGIIQVKKPGLVDANGNPVGGVEG